MASSTSDLVMSVEPMAVPLPTSPDTSIQEVLVGPSDPSSLADVSIQQPSERSDQPTAGTIDTLLLLPARKAVSLTSDAAPPKPMSPEKAALAAMFDSIKMPPPVSSPTKSPRKASNHLLNSPSKGGCGLFGASSSPSKVDSTDSAASRSPMRCPVVIRSSSPGLGHLTTNEDKKASTPLSPAPTSSASSQHAGRSWLAAPSSPSAKLSDLSLVLDTTGTQELLFNQDASFLAAAANTAADVTIDDSFDVSRAKARIRSATTAAPGPRHRSSPAKLGALRAKPRFSTVPEDAAADFKPRTASQADSNSLGLRNLGVGRVVKNAAGDDTIELNLTGSFMGNSSLVLGNLMDESGEASLLFGNNSFSISQSRSPVRAEKQQELAKVRGGARGSKDDEEDDDDDENEDYEREARDVQKWAAEAARKAQQTRVSTLADKTPSRFVGRTATTAAASRAAPPVPAARATPRASLTTPAAASRPPSRAPTVARVASNSPSLKTPTATARIAKPRPSLTGATPRASAAPSVAGSIPRPRASLTGRMSLGPAQAEAKTPVPRAGQIRSASLVTPSARAAARSVQAEATPLGGMRKSASQPQGLDATGDATPAAPGYRARTLVPRASMSRIGTAPPAAAAKSSLLITPRSVRPAAVEASRVRTSARAEALVERTANAADADALRTPLASSKVVTASKIAAPAAGRPTATARTPASGGFGFKPRTSAVFVGSARTASASQTSGENKEN
ncbi:histone 2A [Moesziomyces antarcticus T-34]|uniref:Histone 2A n=1 Tax=Pseudozyma antarctica (strain T-34) TaxID=1151754 RepID=M9LUA9_PSEA3|nr:histone 2A [Moesziomyces antarcticus T-34]